MYVARALVATQVTVTNVSPEQVELAQKVGATRTPNVSEEPLERADVEANVLIGCSGN
jgi:threonine dehydrogenase-like Zn-dependent dehydrogenase